MIKEKNIVIIFNNPWDYHCDYEEQTAKQLSIKNKVFIFNNKHGFLIWKILLDKNMRRKFNSLKKVSNKSLRRYLNINFLPLNRFAFVNVINAYLNLLLFNQFLKKTKNNSEIILWTFSQDDVSLKGRFSENYLVYDCVDPLLVGGKNYKHERSKQKRLVKMSDVVFVNSPSLYRDLKRFNTDTYLVPCGCKVEYFLKKQKQSFPSDLKNIKKPLIGISGTLDWRVNANLLYKLAKANQNWSFVFIGPTIYHGDDELIFEFERLFELPNVFYLGNKNKRQLFDYYYNFDVCLIPYLYNNKPLLNNPMRFYEYLAVGKPVVSVPIEALEVYKPYVSFAKGYKGFEKAVKKEITRKMSMKEIYEREKIAKDNSWNVKVSSMCAILARKINNNNFISNY